MKSPIFFGGRDWHWHGSWRSFDAAGPWGEWKNIVLGTPGTHQIENAATALAALHEVNASSLSIPETAIRAALASAQFPGRFEREQLQGRDVVFDGAHTPAAAAALVDAWRSEFGANRATVILGMGADKDVPTFLQSLRPIMGKLITTRADSPRAADPAIIGEAAHVLGIHATIEPTVADAVAGAIATGHEPILITGSLFVAGEAREAFGLATPDLVWRQLNEEKLSRTNAPKPL
jgi:dihydrofolate synthase/folylpolyglutamate synthase